MTIEQNASIEEAATVLPQAKGPVAICPEELRRAQESFSTIITILLNSGGALKTPKTFYAHFLMKMNTTWGNKVPTAGVNITDKINLFINPTFWNSLDYNQQIELIEHEIRHIVYLHPLRAKDYISTEKNAGGRFKCANIAMDANINDDLKNLCRDLGVTIPRLNKQLKEMGSRFQLDINDPWEVHYEKLMQAAKENPDQGDGDGEGFGDPIDDHGIWNEGTSSKEVAEAIIKDAANKAQAATGIGNMPQDMLTEISNMNKASVNWQRELRLFATSALRYDFLRTRSRRNRRYGVIQPGRKKKPKLSIAVCVDSSGSVCDNSFSQFFAEIGEIYKMDIAITVIDADCEVQSVYEYDPKKPPQRTGRGGTAYQPAITKAMELEVDAIVYFGDMDAADTPIDPKVPFLWAVVGGQNPPASFGKTIRVTTTDGRR